MEVSIDAALARRLVDTQFPRWAGLPLAPVPIDGWDNRTFRLGDGLSVRLPSGPSYAQQVAKEQRWLPRLASVLPLPIPEPIALGEPTDEYPYPWSVYRWLPGDTAAAAPPADDVAFARDLAAFLVVLGGVDAAGGPGPGEHNWFRGAHPEVYGDQTERALDGLGADVDQGGLRRTWDEALRTRRSVPPVWFHGDVSTGNLLVEHGRLSAVIDFGCSGVGDPACDLVIAWTSFGDSARAAFRSARGADAATWARARGWALWKAAISLVGALEADDADAAALNRRTLERVVTDAALTA